jgi:hypothetical protein
MSIYLSKKHLLAQVKIGKPPLAPALVFSYTLLKGVPYEKAHLSFICVIHAVYGILQLRNERERENYDRRPDSERE